MKQTSNAILAALGAGILLSGMASCISSPDDSKDPVAGGARYVLDEAVFATVVDSILTARGCDVVACHGGGIRGTFALSPNTDKDVDFDFQQASLQVNGADPSSSPLLMKPLDEAAGGSSHAASAQQSGFATTAEAGYQAILAWVQDGEYEQ